MAADRAKKKASHHKCQKDVGAKSQSLQVMGVKTDFTETMLNQFFSLKFLYHSVGLFKFSKLTK